MITLIMCCRVEGNSNSALIQNLHKALTMCEDPSNIEVLIKFDDDDAGRHQAMSELSSNPIFSNVSWIVTPRGNGYLDLHKGYNDLYLRSNPDTKLFWVVTDDLDFIEDHWDRILLDAYERGKEDFLGSTAFTLHQNNNHFFDWKKGDEFIYPESYPIWTREWLDCTGGLGHVNFTDAWTGGIEYQLIECYGLDRRVILDKQLVNRVVGAGDGLHSARWAGDRERVHTTLRSPRGTQIFKKLATNVYLHTCLEWKGNPAAPENMQSVNFIDTAGLVDRFLQAFGIYQIVRVAILKATEVETAPENKLRIISDLLAREIIPSIQKIQNPQEKLALHTALSALASRFNASMLGTVQRLPQNAILKPDSAFKQQATYYKPPVIDEYVRREGLVAAIRSIVFVYGKKKFTLTVLRLFIKSLLSRLGLGTQY